MDFSRDPPKEQAYDRRRKQQSPGGFLAITRYHGGGFGRNLVEITPRRFSQPFLRVPEWKSPRKPEKNLKTLPPSERVTV